ncbi:MAG: alpha/beta hydrolase [Planctomycetes bacterium]|nr:alpha/beta hydrolase [Planctomycetota bacterium]
MLCSLRFVRHTLLVSALLALAPLFGMAAEAPQVIPVWPADVPGEKGDVGDEHEQPLKPNDNTIRVANVTRPTLTIFRPAKDKDTGATVIICPGGGYNILAFNKEGTEVAEWLNSIGVTGMVLKYRVPARKGLERHAAPLQDAQRAIGLVRQRASEWGLDPNRIGILGFSAGGHLAAAASNNYDQRTYPTVDAADVVNCRPDFSLLIYPAYLVNKENNALAPEMKITANTPKTFIVMTEDDGVRVEGPLFYYLALKQAKVPAEMHLYPTGGHGYGLRPSEHTVSTWPARAGEWLKAQGFLTARN